MDAQTEAKIYAISQPCKKLIWLYFFRSLSALIFFPLVFFPLFFKYISLRYQFEEDGVGASWGILFRRQVYLTYARVQDIQVSRSLIERWLGIGTVDIQTASGSASAELSIVGLEEYEQVRDFLYTRMRGIRQQKQAQAESAESPSESGQALPLLQEIRDELRALRQEISGEK